MSEETTRDLPDARSFEERVFARFDVMETRFEALEARALDTKPIWERALTEIMEVKQSVDEVKQSFDEVKQEVAEVKGCVTSIERKFDVMILDMMQLRGDQRSVSKRMDALEPSPQ